MNSGYKLYDVPNISTIQEMVLRSAELYADKKALVDLTDYPVKELSFAELLKYIKLLGTGLQSLGIKERAHVAVIGENRVQWGLTYLTALCYNMVIVPVDKNLPTNEILNIIHESESEAVVFSDSYLSLFQEKAQSLKKVKHLICMDKEVKSDKIHGMPEMLQQAGKGKLVDFPSINQDEVCEIIFTSGSLGRAKGVMLSQKNLASNLVAMTKMVNIVSSDRFLSVLPIHHTYECTCGFLCPVYCGSTVYYAKSLKTVTDDLKISKATILLGVPLLYEKMFKRIYKTIHENPVKRTIIPPLIKISSLLKTVGWKNSKKAIFKELHEKFGGEIKLFIAGGAAPDPAIAAGLQEFGFNFIQGYGLTETAPILALNRVDFFKDDAAGLPLPGVSIKINNPDAEGVGEIFAQGPSVMLGYYNNPELTKETFEDGWFKTGDIGYFDSDGFLHISGRKKNVIISKSGQNVFPEELEDVLRRSPFILESLVYGERSEKEGEIIAAMIVADGEAIIEHAETHNEKITPDFIYKLIEKEVKKCNSELSSYKQIKKFTIRDSEFEKTTTQKIKRYKVEA